MSFIGSAVTQAERGLEWANKWHQTIVLWTMIGAMIILSLGALANVAGFAGLNFALAALTLLVGIFFLTKPAFVLSVFGIGLTAKGLPDIKVREMLQNGVSALPNFELERMIGAGWDAVQATMRRAAQALFFLTTVLIVLGTFPVGDAKFILPAFVVLAAFGFWAALFTKGNVWYRNITIGLLVVATGIILFKLYDRPGIVERIEEARAAQREQRIEKALEPVLRKAEHGIKLTREEAILFEKAKKREAEKSWVTKWSTKWQGRTIEYKVPENIAPENLPPVCGIPKGEYSIHVSEGSRLLINAGGTMISEPLTGPPHISRPEQLHRSDYRPFGLMINGAGDGEKVIVDEQGCAVVSFNTMFAQDDEFRSGTWKAKLTTILFRLKPE